MADETLPSVDDVFAAVGGGAETNLPDVDALLASEPAPTPESPGLARRAMQGIGRVARRLIGGPTAPGVTDLAGEIPAIQPGPESQAEVRATPPGGGPLGPGPAAPTPDLSAEMPPIQAGPPPTPPSVVDLGQRATRGQIPPLTERQAGQVVQATAAAAGPTPSPVDIGRRVVTPRVRPGVTPALDAAQVEQALDVTRGVARGTPEVSPAEPVPPRAEAPARARLPQHRDEAAEAEARRVTALDPESRAIEAGTYEPVGAGLGQMRDAASERRAQQERILAEGVALTQERQQIEGLRGQIAPTLFNRRVEHFNARQRAYQDEVQRWLAPPTREDLRTRPDTGMAPRTPSEALELRPEPAAIPTLDAVKWWEHAERRRRREQGTTLTEPSVAAYDSPTARVFQRWEQAVAQHPLMVGARRGLDTSIPGNVVRAALDTVDLDQAVDAPPETMAGQIAESAVRLLADLKFFEWGAQVGVAAARPIFRSVARMVSARAVTPALARIERETVAALARVDRMTHPAPTAALARQGLGEYAVPLTEAQRALLRERIIHQANVEALRVVDRAAQAVHRVLPEAWEIAAQTAGAGGAIGFVEGLQEFTAQLADDPHFDFLQVATEAGKGAGLGALGGAFAASMTTPTMKLLAHTAYWPVLYPTIESGHVPTVGEAMAAGVPLAVLMVAMRFGQGAPLGRGTPQRPGTARDRTIVDIAEQQMREAKFRKRGVESSQGMEPEPPAPPAAPGPTPGPIPPAPTGPRPPAPAAPGGAGLTPEVAEAIRAITERQARRSQVSPAEVEAAVTETLAALDLAPQPVVEAPGVQTAAAAAPPAARARTATKLKPLPGEYVGQLGGTATFRLREPLMGREAGDLVTATEAAAAGFDPTRLVEIVPERPPVTFTVPVRKDPLSVRTPEQEQEDEERRRDAQQDILTPDLLRGYLRDLVLAVPAERVEGAIEQALHEMGGRRAIADTLFEQSNSKLDRFIQDAVQATQGELAQKGRSLATEKPPAGPPRFEREEIEQALREADGDYIAAAEALAQDDNLLSVLNAANQARKVSPAFNLAMGSRPRSAAMLQAERKARATEDRGGFDPENIEDLIGFVKARGGLAPSPTGDLQGELEAIPREFRRKRGLSPSAMAEALTEHLGYEAMNDAELLDRLSRAPQLRADLRRRREIMQEEEQEARARARRRAEFDALDEAEKIKRLRDLTGASEADARRLLAREPAAAAPDFEAPEEEGDRAAIRRGLVEAFLADPEADARAVLDQVGGADVVTREVFGGDVAALDRMVSEARRQAQEANRLGERRRPVEGERPELAPAKPAFLRPGADTPSETGYHYHATNEEGAATIARSGLAVFPPEHGTDQQAWPDGGTEPRAYFNPKAGVVWPFAPAEGEPVLLRVPQTRANFRKESGTGDTYTTKPVAPEAIEIGMADGSWVPLREAFGVTGAAPRFEKAEGGEQARLGELPARAVPKGPIRATKPQKEDAGPLFTQEKDARQRAADEGQGRLFQGRRPVEGEPPGQGRRVREAYAAFEEAKPPRSLVTQARSDDFVVFPRDQREAWESRVRAAIIAGRVESTPVDDVRLPSRDISGHRDPGGRVGDIIESEVREAVVALNRAGAETFESGWFRDGGDSFISFLVPPEQALLDRLRDAGADRVSGRLVRIDAVGLTRGEVKARWRRLADAAAPAYQHAEIKVGGETRVVAGFDPRILDVLGGNLYSGGLDLIAVKEAIQNAVDAVRGQPEAKIVVRVTGKRIRVEDTGTGMPRAVLVKEFVDIGGTLKAAGASGGFGIAKVAILANAATIKVVSVTDTPEGRKRHTLSGTGEGWKDESVGMKIEAEDAAGAPTGTLVDITLKDEVRTDDLQLRAWLIRMLTYSTVPIEWEIYDPVARSTRLRPFTTLDQRPLETVRFEGGTGAVSISPEQDSTTSVVAHVLNRGLYQFSKSWWIGDAILLPKTTVLDVSSKLQPEAPGYPFTPSREALRGDAAKAIEDYFKGPFVTAYRKRDRNRLEDALRDMPRIGDTGMRLMDPTQSLPREAVEQIASRTLVRTFAVMAREFVVALQGDPRAKRRSGRYGDGDFMGVTLGLPGDRWTIIMGTTYNLPEVLTEAGYTRKVVVLNPFGIARMVRRLLDNGQIEEGERHRVFAEQVADTVTHELSHLRVWNHGSEHAQAQAELILMTPALHEAHVAAFEEWAASQAGGRTVLDVLEDWAQEVDDAAVGGATDIFGKVGSNAAALAEPGDRGGGEGDREARAAGGPERAGAAPGLRGGPAGERPGARPRRGAEGVERPALRWLGWQEGFGRIPAQEQWNLTGPWQGRPAESTLGRPELEAMGFTVPPPPEPAPGAAEAPAGSAGPHKYSSTELRVPPGLADALRAFARAIPAAHRRTTEQVPHVTVRYGLQTNEPDLVRRALEGTGPIEVVLGVIKAFPENEDGVPLYVEVQSPALDRLHEKLTDELTVVETQDRYRPHITLGYLRPGTEQHYVGKRDFAGRRFTANEVVFSPRSGEEPSVLPLRGGVERLDPERARETGEEPHLREPRAGVQGERPLPAQVQGAAERLEQQAKMRATDEATGLPLNDDGTVTVYHGTTAAAAEAIRRTGRLTAAAEPDVYVTTDPAGGGYGDGTVVSLRITPRRLQIDDEFPDGRRDFRISVGRPGGSVPVKLGPPAELREGRRPVEGEPPALLPGRAEFPGFFSALRKAAEKRLMPKQSRAQVLGVLRSAPGVKEAERHWTGLEGWLADQPEPVAKQTVLDYLQAHEVRIATRELSEADVVVAPDEYDWGVRTWSGGPVDDEDREEGDDSEPEEHYDHPSGYRIYGNESWLGWTVLDDMGEEIGTANRFTQADDLAERHYNDMTRDAREAAESSGPRHGDPDLNLPGGEPGTYRERLYVWPAETLQTPDASERMALGIGTDVPVWYEPPEAHFPDAPNTFAHARLDDGWVLWPDGRREPALRAQEFQSDARHAVLDNGEKTPEPPPVLTELPEGYTVSHEPVDPSYYSGDFHYNPVTKALSFQEARRNGRTLHWNDVEPGAFEDHMDPGAATRLRSAVAQRRPEVEAVVASGRTARRRAGKAWVIRQPDGVIVTRQGHGRRQDAVAEALGKINADRHRAWEQAVPPFPFLKNWLEVVFKDAVMEAARTGKKWLVWTTGRQQAERWSQQVHDNIEALAWGELGGDTTLRGWRRGNATSSAPDFKETVSEKDLPKYVGKDLAAKLVAAPNQFLRDQDLTLGGEEFRALYDEIAMNVARAFAKPWKARVEDVQVQGKGYKDFTPDQINRAVVFEERISRERSSWAVAATPYMIGNGFSTREAAEEFLADVKAQMAGITMHGMEITDAMVEAVRTEGLPLFQRRRAPTAEQVVSLQEEVARAPIRPGEPESDHALAVEAVTDLLAVEPIAGLAERGGVPGHARPARPEGAGGRAAGAPAGRVPPGLPAPPAGPGGPDTPARGRLLQPPREYRPLAVPSGVEVVGLGIAAEIAAGPVRLIGRTIRGPEDLAQLYQAARDPRFETFRVVALSAPDAEGRRRVLDHLAMSQRIPGSVNTFLGRIGPDGRWTIDSARDFEWLRDWLERVGAAGYVMLHNHPSGNAQPTWQDVSMTAAFQAFLPGLLYHVVIDSRQYALIRPGQILRRKEQPALRDRGVLHTLSRGGDLAIVQMGKRETDIRMPAPEIRPLDVDETLLVPGRPHAFLGIDLIEGDIFQAGKLAAMSRALGGPGEDATVAIIDGEGRTRSIERVAFGLLGTLAQADRYITARRRAVGGTFVMVAVAEGAAPHLDALSPDLIRAGIVHEYVVVRAARHDPMRSLTRRAYGDLAEDSPSLRRRARRGSQLSETRPPVEGEPPQDPDQRDLEIIGRHFLTDPPAFEPWAEQVRAVLPAAFHHLLPELFERLTRQARGETDARPFPRREDGQRVAGTLNLEHYFESMENADDIRRLLVDVEAPRHAEFERHRRGVIGDDTMEQLARESGVTVERLVSLQAGTAWTPERIRRARQLLATSAAYLHELKGAAARPEADPRETARFVAHFHRHALIQKAVVGLAAEAGRALREFSRPIEPGIGRSAMEQWSRIIDRLGGPERARQAAELLARLPEDDLEAINVFTRNAVQPSAHDKFYEYWINALLSGPRTHIVNIVSNFAFATERGLVERALAAGIDVVRVMATGGERARWAGEVLAETYAMPVALQEAWQAFGTALTTGQTRFGQDIGQLVNEMRQPAIGTGPNASAFARRAGQVIRFPTRALLAEDEFFKFFAYRLTLHAEAYRQAAREGIEGRARFARAADIVADERAWPDLVERAAHEARVRTFTDEGPAFVKKLIELRETGIIFEWFKPLKYIIPFVKTPERIFTAAAQRTPLYALKLALDEIAYQQELRQARRSLELGTAEPIQPPLDIGGGGGGQPPRPPRRPGSPEPEDDAARHREDRERLARLMVKRQPLRGGEASDAWAKIALGTMAMIWGALMVEWGFMTGGGPSDPQEKAVWRKTREPYSWWTPWGYIGYKRLGPLGMVLAGTADLAEGFNESVKKGRASAVARVIAAINEIVLDQSFLTGPRDLGRLVADPYRYAQLWTESMATSVIPALIRQMVPAIDPTLRAPSGIDDLTSPARARIPFLSGTVRERFDHWGRPITLDPAQRVSRILLPFDVAFHQYDPADAELLRLHVGLSKPRRSAGGLELTPAEFERYEREGGQAAHAAVLRLIEQQGYRARADRPDWQIDRVEEVVAQARARVRDRVLRDIPVADRKKRRLAKAEEALHPEIVRRLHEPPDWTPPEPEPTR